MRAGPPFWSRLIPAGLPDRSVQVWIIGTAPPFAAGRADLGRAAGRDAAGRATASRAGRHGSWSRPCDLLAAVQEHVIPDMSPAQETVGLILADRHLLRAISEIPGYSWSESHAEAREDVSVKVDDHAADALRYGCATTGAAPTARPRSSE